MDSGETFSCWRCEAAGRTHLVDPLRWDLGHEAGEHRGPECRDGNRATSGRGRDATHQCEVVLVCGPPCSGKSTYVRTHARPTDLVVDFDVIAQQLGSIRPHNHDAYYREKAERVVQQLIDEVAAGQHERAWVIRALPRQQARSNMVRRLGARRVVVLDELDSVLYERARTRPEPDRTIEAIDWWRRTASL